MIILSETLYFSILVSLYVQGLGAATNHGGILFPLKVWMEEISRSYYLEKRLKKIAEYKERRRRLYQSSEWVNQALKKIELQIIYRNLWHKPLLTCINCMPSFWGTIIYFTLYYQYDFYVWFLGVPLASAINVLTQRLRP